MPNSLVNFFNPKSICIIGASRDEHKIGNIVIRNILASGYKGKLYPINPNADQINGLTCYKSTSELPEVPDLAIISVPAEFVLAVIDDLASKKISNAVVFSAGFKEIGNEGKKLETELAKKAAKYKINILGPNCLGFLNNKVNLNATFAQAPNILGNLNFISQSGAIASSIFDWINTNGLGIDTFVTLGNKAVLNENDILEYWLENGSTNNPIAMYLESISDGKRFLELARNFTQKSPILVLKPGKSPEAQKAMMSHTGALAGEYKIMQTAFEQASIVLCDGIQELFDYSMAFTWEKAPQGPNVCIISNAGGPGVITSDLIAEHGLKLAQIPDSAKETLYKALPRAASLLDPIDLLGDAMADRYKTALETVLPLKEVDAVVVLLTPQVMTQVAETAKVIAEIAKKQDKPVLCSFIGGHAFVKGYEILCKNKIPVYEFPERAVKTLAAMWNWKKSLAKPVSQIAQTTQSIKKLKRIKIITDALALGQQALDIEQSFEIAKKYGLNIPRNQMVATFDEAKKFAHANYPVVLKVSSSQSLHKTEQKAVVTNINSESDLKTEFEKLQKRLNEFSLDAKINIQGQVESGVEIIVGIKKDPSFGQILMFGAGGTVAELVQDTNLYVNPTNIFEIQKLVESSKVFKLLNGYRNTSPYDLTMLYEQILKLIQISEEISEISEIEINPAIITHDQTYTVDIKILL